MPTLIIHAIDCKVHSTGVDQAVVQSAINVIAGAAKVGAASAPFLGPVGGAVGAALTAASELILAIPGLIAAIDAAGDSPDQLYLSLSNDPDASQRIWPLPSENYEIRSGQIVRPNLIIPFTNVIDITFWEYDSGSSDDFLGRLTVDTSHAGGVRYQLVARPSEGNIYVVAYSVEGVPTTNPTPVPVPVTVSLRNVTPAVARYTHGGTEKMYVFVPDANGRLRCYFGNGTAGQWGDQGLPEVGTQAVSAPATTTAVGFDSGYPPSVRIHAYVVGNNGQLYENYWNLHKWIWVKHGYPSGATQPITTDPIAYAFRKQSSGSLSDATDVIYVGLATKDGNLWVRVWGRPASGGNFQWQWVNHGLARKSNSTQIKVVSEPAITTYSVNGKQRIYLFVRGDDGSLYERYWDGTPNQFDTNLTQNTWHWTEHGQPSSTVKVASAPVIQLFPSDPTRDFCVFVVGSDGGLYLRRWNNTTKQWLWDNLNKPSNFPQITGRPAVSYFKHDGTNRIYIYLKGTDNKTYLCFWDSKVWQWRASEAPLPRPITTAATVTPFQLGADQQMYSYRVGDDNKLYSYCWKSGSWQWLFLGSP